MKRLYKKKKAVSHLYIPEEDFIKLKYLSEKSKVSIRFYIYSILARYLKNKKVPSTLLEYRYLTPTLKELLDDSD